MSQLAAILVDKTVPGKNDISGRFSESAGREDIPCNAPCRLLADERAEITMFTNTFVIGRKVEQDFRTLER